MARPLRIEYPGAFYHVTSRGNERKDIFKSQRDREQFLSYLASAVVRYGAVVHTWCLMSNHYHLLLETPLGNLSQIMRHLNGAYTTYFNVTRKRAGHLFQGRYKAILVEADAYALALSRYIHLNPVRAGMVVKPEDYPWSSYRSYIGDSLTPEWLKTDFIHGYLGGRASRAKQMYRRFVEDLLGRVYASPLNDTVASTILGREEFVRDVVQRHLGRIRTTRSLPAVKALVPRPSIEAIITTIRETLGDGAEWVRAVSLYGCQHYSGAKLKDIGARFGISDAAVSQASRRIALRAETDRHLKHLLNRVETCLRQVKG
jgi:putative transposase